MAPRSGSTSERSVTPMARRRRLSCPQCERVHFGLATHAEFSARSWRSDLKSGSMCARFSRDGLHLRAVFHKGMRPLGAFTFLQRSWHMRIGHWSFPSLVTVATLTLGGFLLAGGADAQNARKAEPAGAAATPLITGSSFDAIISALEDNGFSVDMTTDSDGDPLIESTDD